MADPRTFTTLLLDNVGSGENITWLTTSSMTVLTCVKGGVTITDETDGASITLIAMNDGDPTLRHKILDLYQGARLKATATAAGTTFRVSKHAWQEL